MAEYVSEDDAVTRQSLAYPDLRESLVDHDFQRRRVAVCVEMVHWNDIVLDVGCNSGYFAELCKGIAAEVHGVDVNPTLVELAKYCMMSARVARAEALPYPDKTFDVVHLGGVLEMVYDPAIVLAECARVSRRSVIGNTAHADGAWGVGRLPWHPWHVRALNEIELRGLLEGIGTITRFGTTDIGDQPHVFFFEVRV